MRLKSKVILGQDSFFVETEQNLIGVSGFVFFYT